MTDLILHVYIKVEIQGPTVALPGTSLRHNGIRQAYDVAKPTTRNISSKGMDPLLSMKLGTRAGL